ncbi:hypothetical protein CspHIS471_0410530 [Cutaneotrichosporon sp. HIS471]|nr:hypothetical protein CspHIS471_0410530 [Cutaneotrichosporon sp. HIS471]
MAPRQDYDKIVKLACKPKNAPPKAKYLDALIAATFDDNALNDITRALSMRLRDNNPVVVFKALITLHQMMRSGASEQLLGHLARSDALRLRNVQGMNDGAGYHPPSNMSAYAYYLDSRIRAFRDLRHDLVYLQTESNRRSTGLGANSKARRLRHLPVDKGLLREVKQVQRILDALIRCTFYDDDLRDENTVLAFRMLIKDLLVLFQAGNEGVCNILEHYFEMSKVDATASFDIYKSFIKQTDKIVEYLAVARRLNNIVNVPVPNLKHAPTSLVKALDEYLNDPNFEQNRLEYKKSLGVVEARPGDKSSAGGKRGETKDDKAAESSKSAPTTAPPAPVANAQAKIQDFLESIENEQSHSPTSPVAGSSSMNSVSMGGMGMGMGMGQFGQMPMGQMGPMGSMSTIGSMGGQMPMQMQMTGMANPFRQSTMFPQQTGFMAPQMTGFPNSQGFMQQPQQQGSFLQPQTTGFLQPSLSGGGNPMFQAQRQSTFPLASTSQPFGQMAGDGKQSSLLAQPNQNNPFPSSLHPQQTGFLQPQTTGSNPFRQSTMPQATGMASNAMMGMGGMGGMGMSHTGGMGGMGMSGSFSQPATPFGQPNLTGDNRPSSTPNVLGSVVRTDSPKPLTAQKTGSNNPFAPPGGIPQPAPPMPHQPNMNEMAQQRFQAQFAAAGGLNPQQQMGQQHAQPQQQPNNDPWNFDPLSSSSSTAAKPSSAMGDIASAFAMDKQPGQDDFFSQFNSLSVMDSNANVNSGSGGFLQPQRTGVGGSAIKPFKPTSSFGAQLEQSLPPIPEPGGVTSPGANGVGTQATGFPFNSGSGPSSPGAGGATLGEQATGFPFSAGLGTLSTGFPGGLGAQSPGSAQSPAAGVPAPSTGFPFGGLNAQPTGFQPTSSFGQQLAAQHTQNPGAQLQRQNTGSNPFRGVGGPGVTGSGPFGAGSPFAGQNMFGAGQQHQQQQASLF